MSLGEFIREKREARDLSLREFAKKINVSAAFQSDVELGRRFPSDELQTAIARELRVTIADLKARDTRPPVEEMKKRIASNPAYAFAFRLAADSKLSPDELIDALRGQNRAAGPKKKS